jgi:hypothetical protein
LTTPVASSAPLIKPIAVEPPAAPNTALSVNPTTANDLRTSDPHDGSSPRALDMEPGQTLGELTRFIFCCWVIVFALVGAQMGWVRRPFIGNPDQPFSWFRERESNFFEAVIRTLETLLSRG